MPDELSELIRTADALGLRGARREQYVVDHGGSRAAYRSYTRRAALRLAVSIVALVGSVAAGIYGWWTWYEWGPAFLRSLR
ncbi:MAG TPA: hypothetical protein VF590_11345 [Isosphaeraceae bacterium]|jgi:hypothetical protein